MRLHAYRLATASWMCRILPLCGKGLQARWYLFAHFIAIGMILKWINYLISMEYQLTIMSGMVFSYG
jgi:hypothetical protein